MGKYQRNTGGGKGGGMEKGGRITGDGGARRKLGLESGWRNMGGLDMMKRTRKGWRGELSDKLQ